MNRNDFVFLARTVHASASEKVSYKCLNIRLRGKYFPFY